MILQLSVLFLFPAIVMSQPVQSKSAQYQNLKKRSIVKTDLLWDIGQTIRIKFLTATLPRSDRLMRPRATATFDRSTVCGPEDLKSFKQGVADWMPNVNLNFVYVESGNAEIRVACNRNQSSSSQVGKNSIKSGKYSLNYAGYAAHHEFGHAIGLYHEQESPAASFSFNCSSTIVTDYEKNNKVSNEEACKVIKLSYGLPVKGGKDEFHYSQFDYESTMLYGAAADFLSRPADLVGKADLSIIDKVYGLGLYPYQAYRDIDPRTTKRRKVPNVLTGFRVENLKPEQCADGYSFIQVGDASCCAQKFDSEYKRLVFASNGVVYVVYRSLTQDAVGHVSEVLLTARLSNMRNHIYGTNNLFKVNKDNQLVCRASYRMFRQEKVLKIEGKPVMLEDGKLGVDKRFAFLFGPFEHTIGFRTQAEGIVDGFKLV